MKETLDEELLVEHIKSYSTRDILMLVNDGELLKKLSTKSILPLVDRAAQLFSTNQMGDRTMSHIMDKIFFHLCGTTTNIATNTPKNWIF